MFKRLLVLLLIITLLASPLFAEAELSYEPYGEEEFPIWTMKMRRAESLFFGSLVITLPVSMLAWSLMANAGWVNGETNFSNFLCQAGIASALSLTIATTDFIIGEVQGD